ncbi:hypothetical protein KI387_023589 [Taxus chinensis]|uniref:Uncharacterized protein n=1 Tax=Taxus chinensis TaxID=29808 RepID=A0AA38LBV3_TAXCH|nr:hypothetical protein KI387_023589 [Taxus chinensis]
MKQPNLTVTIESSDDEYDGELLVDWRGKALTKTPKHRRSRSRSRCRSRSRSTNKNKKNATPRTDQFDPQVCRNISSLLVENSPEVSVTRHIFNTAEMSLAEGFTPSFILETPMSAQLRAGPSKFCDMDTENMPFLPTLLNKCSGGGDVICLDSDNESNRHVSADDEIIRKHREEERKCKQQEIERNKREKEAEKQRQKEEKRLKKEEEKMRKESAKTEAAEMRNRQKEIKKWEKGKFALKSISAEIDTKVIERGLIAGMCI